MGKDVLIRGWIGVTAFLIEEVDFLISHIIF